MEQSSWEGNIHLTSQEITCLLWNPKVHYCVLKILPLDPVLSQMNPVKILTPYFFKIHFNIIFPCIPRPSNFLFPLGFPTEIFYSLLMSPMCAKWLAHPTWFDFSSRLIYGEIFLYSPIISSILGPDIHLQNLSWNPLSLRSPLHMKFILIHNNR